MDYDQIIPLLVVAVQEQQGIIDSLRFEITAVQNNMQNNYSGMDQFKSANSSGNSKSVLFQNKPNPFSGQTIIEFEINEINFKSASVEIFDMSGVLLKSFPFDRVGKTN